MASERPQHPGRVASDRQARKRWPLIGLAVVVAVGAVVDEKDVVVVVVELRPLTELFGVLEGERVKVEDPAQLGRQSESASSCEGLVELGGTELADGPAVDPFGV